MGKKQKSLRSKAVHFVSDLTTVFLNPISDKPSKPLHQPTFPNSEHDTESKRSQPESVTENDHADLPNGPDTSSFSAFLYSLLSSSESQDNTNLDDQNDDQEEPDDQPTEIVVKETKGKKSLFSRGKNSLGKVIYQAAKMGGYKNQEQKDDVSMKIIHDKNDGEYDGLEMRHMQNSNEPEALLDVPGMSEPSMLLTEKTRSALYASIPALVKGRKWLMLYSTWRHGISLSTLYRRSMLWPGLSLLVVGDRKGAVFGGLVEAPLRPTDKKYQGTNNTFVFTNVSGHPAVFHPTGANRYFTLCSNDCLAIGGGGHFALYLDSDLLSGSSSVSETYANPCLANSEDFEVKEVELWGFVYASKFEEILTLSRAENPGICRW